MSVPSEKYDFNRNDELSTIFTQDLSAAKARFHRRLFVLAGKDYNNKFSNSLSLLNLLAHVANKNLSGYLLLTGDDIDITGQQFKDLVKIYNKKSKYNITLKLMTYKESIILLGQTFNFIILDVTKTLHPDDIGRLIETVEGGGIIILWAPPFEDWPSSKLFIHDVMVSPPFTIEHIKHRYLIRFIKKLFEHKGIHLIDVDAKKVIRKYEESDTTTFTRPTPDLPDTHIMPLEVYELALTQDQVDAIKQCEIFLSSRKKKKTSVILIADRGRGKTVSLALALAGLAYSRYNEDDVTSSFIVTSPRYENILPLFNFFQLAIEKLNGKIKIEKDSTGRILEIRTTYGSITYLPPLNCLRKNCDLLIVDEAAGLPVYLLYGFIDKHDNTIFSSTIHGYEGAGRSFSIRFLGHLDKRKNLEYVHFKLVTPIRYAPDDPIEKWLYDTLFLDAEPVSLTDIDLQDISKFNLTLSEVDLDTWFSGRNEAEAKQFVGIYVYAHYRNRPRDIAFLADAPHHNAYALKTSTGAIVTSIQTAEEGNMPKEAITAIYKKRRDFHGQVIPHAMIVHQRMPTFASFKGLRIVRIATHPEVMKKGLGSFALQELSRIAKKDGYVYLSAIFGANKELLKFWIKNGFIPVHISPDRNPISGEYSVAVIKPLGKKISNLVIAANNELRVRVLGWLPEQLKDLDPSVAYMLMQPFDVTKRFYIVPPEITIKQWEKLHGYALELMTYEAVADGLRKLITLYILDASASKPRLNPKQIDLIIMKCLQIRDWKNTADALGSTVKWCFIELVHIVRRLLKFYTTPEIWKKIGVKYRKAQPPGIEEEPFAFKQGVANE